MKDKGDKKRHITVTSSSSEMRRHSSVSVRPTEGSLDIAERMAHDLSMPFDRETTRRTGADLLALYYRDIRTVASAALGEVDVAFEHGSSGRIEAFAALSTHNTRAIFIDEYLQFWLFSMNFLTTFRACYTFSDDERRELARLFYMASQMLADPLAHHELLRAELLPLMKRFVRILPAVNALTQCMSVFVICHEVAHHLHDHVQHNVSERPEHEFVADRVAYDLLDTIHDARSQLQHAQIDTSTLCGPCLLLDYFAAALSALGQEDGPTSSHPSLLERQQRLIGDHRAQWPEQAETKYNALSDSLKALQVEYRG